MKILIGVLLGAVLILTTPTKHINNSANQHNKQQVQATANERKPLTQQEPSPQLATVADTTAQPTVKTVVQNEPKGCDYYSTLLAKYNWDMHVMTAIMRAESSCVPDAVNRYNYDGIYDYGLLQLHGQEIYDPAANIQAGYNIWLRQGYRAWSTYNSGAYLRFL